MVDLYPFVIESARAMVFVDGENLAIRYGKALKELGGLEKPGVLCLPNVAVWCPQLSPPSTPYPGRA